MSHHEIKRKEVEAREKQPAVIPAEGTRPGAVFTPEVDIYENKDGITLVADMPGVKHGDLIIDVNENVLTIVGEVGQTESKNETGVLREYALGRYMRQFTVGRDIDRDRIEAAMANGVLTLILPKAEKAKPRKISVKAG
jgi:HSP20 family protein